jgi:hypothetical protein
MSKLSKLSRLVNALEKSLPAINKKYVSDKHKAQQKKQRPPKRKAG